MSNAITPTPNRRQAAAVDWADFHRALAAARECANPATASRLFRAAADAARSALCNEASVDPAAVCARIERLLALAEEE